MRWTVASQIWREDTTVSGNQKIGYFIVGMDVIGETMKKYHWCITDHSGFIVDYIKNTCVNLFQHRIFSFTSPYQLYLKNVDGYNIGNFIAAIKKVWSISTLC